ncbi:hypothetical protein BO78DRAFT_303248, partial [Aspergillus sclerotiicarbonarius CBS 121057]
MKKGPLPFTRIPCNYPLYDANQLQEPPAGAIICGVTKETLVTELNKRGVAYKDLLEFYAWGSLQGTPKCRNIPTKDRKISALIKILYNLDDKHQPRSTDELCELGRDAGPRLLKPSAVTENLLPISRFYPNPPGPETELKRGYVRPIDAPEFVPDLYLERMAEKSVWKIKRGRTGEQALAPAVKKQEEEASRQSDERQQGEASRHVPAIDREAHLPIVEEIERVVIKFAYSELERDPTAASLEAARPYITATGEGSLTSVIFGAFPATSQVQLAHSPQASNSLHFDKNGHVYPYRGRGPVWSNFSSAADCVIVAGRLLDAGSTKVDRSRQGWQGRFTPVERAFIEATDVNWDVCSLKESIELRDRFLRLIQPAHAPGEDIEHLRHIWQLSAHNFDQFRAIYTDTSDPCACNFPAGSNAYGRCTSAATSGLKSNRDGISLQDALSQTLAVQRRIRCERCGKKFVNCRRRYTKLAWRLALKPGPKLSARSHTQDLTIAYFDEQGREQTASYRWLGGIYSHNGHMRLYWTDANRGEHDNTGMLRMYDSTENRGLIVGGIAPASWADRVPEEYWRDKQIPLLFYERIMNPSTGDLHVALSTVTNMLQTTGQGKLILKQNPGWAPSGNPGGQDVYPWKPLLPPLGRRFN